MVSHQFQHRLRMNYSLIPKELRPIAEKIEAAARVSEADALTLYRATDLNALGLMANVVRERKNGNFNRGTGPETRHTVGSRLWRTGRLFDINYEVIGQFGTWSGLPIRAWAVSTDTGFTHNLLKAKSRFGLRGDVASGDSRRNSLGSFNPLFPSTSYTGSIALFGPTNPRTWGPIGRRARIIWKTKLEDISVDEVLQTLKWMI